MMKKSHIYKLIPVLLVLLVLILAVGGCRKAGSWLVKSDEVQHADAMLMLMGIQAERVLQIADLYQEGVADRVWIVKEGMGASDILEERGVDVLSTTSQVQGYLVDLGIPVTGIKVIPGGATSTQMEATLLRDYLAALAKIKSPGIDTLLVVSSASHTRRASMIFSAALKTLDNPPVICTCPSSYSDFNAEKWWLSREDIQDVVLEYLKILNFALFERRHLK